MFGKNKKKRNNNDFPTKKVGKCIIVSERDRKIEVLLDDNFIEIVETSRHTYNFYEFILGKRIEIHYTGKVYSSDNEKVANIKVLK